MMHNVVELYMSPDLLWCIKTENDTFETKTLNAIAA